MIYLSSCLVLIQYIYNDIYIENIFILSCLVLRQYIYNDDLSYLVNIFNVYIVLFGT